MLVRVIASLEEDKILKFLRIILNFLLTLLSIYIFIFIDSLYKTVREVRNEMNQMRKQHFLAMKMAKISKI